MPEQSVQVPIYTPEAEYEHKLIIPHIETSTISLLSLLCTTVQCTVHTHIYEYARTDTDTNSAHNTTTKYNWIFISRILHYDSYSHAAVEMLLIAQSTPIAKWMTNNSHIHWPQEDDMKQQTHTNHLTVVSQEIPSHQRKKCKQTKWAHFTRSVINWLKVVFE